jgi:hypothetical protein
MGLLDEAIKEHLELKRRRGADAGEVAREEAEALGPVRRDRAPEPEPEEAADHGAVAGRAEAAEPEHHGAVRAPEDGAEAEHHGVFHEPHEDDAPPHGDPVGEEAYGHHEHPVDYEPEPEPEPEATPPHGDPLLHQPTREFAADEVSEALGHDAGPPADLVPPTAPSGEAADGDPDVVPADDEGEDVLEETPEFLQETPEHDRLWFEQKPPKDFDF